MSQKPIRIDRKQAAKYLGIHPDTLNMWAYRGYPRLPYYRLGRKVVYDIADLDAFLKRHKVDTGEDV